MNLYLTAEPSLALTRYLRAVDAEVLLNAPIVRKKALGDAINSSRLVNELDPEAQRWLNHTDHPVHAFIAERSKGTSTNEIITHVLSKPVPSGAFLDIGHGVRICAPGFMFMQLAASNDLLETIRIGMELCGYYSYWRLEPNDFGNPYYQERAESQACTFELAPAAQLKRLSAYVERHPGLRGAVRARSALHWMVARSASPMETAVYLLLCLPRRLGGYGLPKPTLNPKVIVSTAEGKKERYPDLFWPSAGIDVEYNSDAKHSGEWSRYRDSKREIELTVANIKVLPLTRPQLMNASEFDAFAQGLRRLLGVRTRRTDAGWHFRHSELREKLLSSWS